MTEALLAAAFGLLIGSFLNVCIYRLPRERSVIKPRSYCPRCRQTIAWYDNIPVLSYVILRGQCRHCGLKIACRYPLVEILTGVAFGVIVWLYGPTPLAVRFVVLASILIALAFTDLARRILPDELTLGGAAIGLILAGLIPLEHDVGFFVLRPALGVVGASLAASAIGALIPCSILGGIGWVWGKLRGMDVLGLGDVKMIATVGTFLGLQSTLAALVISSILGVVFGSAHIYLTKRDFTYQLPYGTYITIGTIGYVLLARQLLV
jgi:leader peptidase (prepilin peptidase) / N-methyltransferase